MDKSELTPSQKNSLAIAERQAAKVLIGILIDEELAFTYNEASDYILIDPARVQGVTTQQLIEIFGTVREDCTQVSSQMFVVKDDKWPDEAFFEVYDLAPVNQRVGERPALIIRFRDDL